MGRKTNGDIASNTDPFPSKYVPLCPKDSLLGDEGELSIEGLGYFRTHFFSHRACA